MDGEGVSLPMARADSPAVRALERLAFEGAWPYSSRDFGRLDRGDDAAFYAEPRFVKHVDDKALAALTAYYAAVFPKSQPFAALDVCSSWVSHYPADPRPARLAVMGMNEEELRRNEQATEVCVRDLNQDPRLPFADGSFDVVTNAVSVDYLTKPREVFMDIARVLRPGGLATVAYSNRCFLTKVVALWSSEDDAGHAEIVASYFHHAGGFRDIAVADISPGQGGDPMYVVSAVRL